MSTSDRGVVIRLLASVALAALSGTLPKRATAETIFFGPTPYLSAADSPFDLSGLGTTMFLEDFEDGELNTPGVSAVGRMQVQPPAPQTDSVDADDGFIDGFGFDGHSAVGGNSICTGTDPPTCSTSIAFQFDADVLGEFPSAVGIVLTDGAWFQDEFSVAFLDAMGNLIRFPGAPFVLGQDDPFGSGNDRFFGVIHPEGISVIALGAGPPGGFLVEADHLQYGFFVPEPATGTLIVVSFMLLLTFKTLCRKSRTRDVLNIENRSRTHAPCKRWNPLL